MINGGFGLLLDGSDVSVTGCPIIIIIIITIMSYP